MESEVQTTLACAVAITMATVAVIMSGVLPLLVVIPAMLGSTVHWLLGVAAIGLPALAFLAWHPGLFDGARECPRRTTVLGALVAILQLAWFWVAWDYGVRYQGFWYCVLLLGANLTVIGLFLVVERHVRRQPNFPTNLLLHALLFAWLGTVAFPWLGELP